MFGHGYRSNGRSRSIAMQVALTMATLWFGAPRPQAAAQRAEPTEQVSYESAIREAVRALHEGAWSEARASFQRAHELRPSARTLRGLGIAEYELQDHVNAHLHLRAAIADPRRPLDEKQKSHAERMLSSLRTQIGLYRVEVAPPSAEWTVDGAPPRLDDEGHAVLTPGQHTLTATAPEHQAFSQELTTRGGEKESLRIELPATPPPPPAPQVAELAPTLVQEPPPLAAMEPQTEVGAPSRWPWVVIASSAAVTVLGLTLGAVGVRSKSKVEEVNDGRTWSSIEGAYDRATVLTPLGFTLAGIGLGGAATGVWLLSRRAERERRPVLSVSARGVELRGVYR